MIFCLKTANQRDSINQVIFSLQGENIPRISPQLSGDFDGAQKTLSPRFSEGKLITAASIFENTPTNDHNF